eukprot:3206676-Rhodomonas_salina.7
MLLPQLSLPLLSLLKPAAPPPAISVPHIDTGQGARDHMAIPKMTWDIIRYVSTGHGEGHHMLRQYWTWRRTSYATSVPDMA